MQVLDVPKVDRRARLAQLIRLYEQGQVSDLMDRTLYKLFSVEAAEDQSIALRLGRLRGAFRYGIARFFSAL